MKRKEVRYTALIVFICVGIWQPIIFRLVMAIMACFFPACWGIIFIRNTFNPFIGKDSLYGGLTDGYGRMYSLLIGIACLLLVAGIFLSVLGFNVGNYLGILSNIIFSFALPFCFLVLVIISLLGYLGSLILSFTRKRWFKGK